MAIEAQSQGQFHEVLAVVKRRIFQVVLPAILGVAIGGAVGVLLPREYEVSTQVELREVVLPIGGFGGSSQAIRRDITSARFHVKSLERIRRVIEKLEWQDFTPLTAAEKYEYLKRVAAAVQVTVVGGAKNMGSSFIFITYTDSDGQRAEHFLNRLRDSYTGEVVERFRNTARDARDTLQNQLSIAHQAYIDKQRQSTELKKRYGLSPTQQTAGFGPRDEDPVFTRLATARAELAAVIHQLTAAKTQKKTLEERYNDAPREVPEQSLTGGLGYDTLLVQIRADIETWKRAQDGLRPEHSRYQQAESEIQKLLDRQRGIEDRAFSQGDDDVRMVLNPLRTDLAQRIDDLELKIKTLEAERRGLEDEIAGLALQSAELTDVYREAAQLDGEVANARKAHDTARALYDRQKAFVEFIAQPHANPFTVAEVARALTEPSSPAGSLMMFAGLVLGLVIGVGSAMAAEFGRSAFRSATDLSRALAVPVLGAVNSIVTRREARAMMARRAMVVSSTLILAGVIFWVTWAYEEQPRLLGPQLTHFIDGLRMELR